MMLFDHSSLPCHLTCNFFPLFPVSFTGERIVLHHTHATERRYQYALSVRCCLSANGYFDDLSLPPFSRLYQER